MVEQVRKGAGPVREDLLRPIHELLATHARQRGSRVAFTDSRRSVDYAALYERTAREAANLGALGVQRGDRVAVWMPTSVDAVEIRLAVARASAVSVLISPAATDAQLAVLLADCGVSVVVADAKRCERISRNDAFPGLSVVRFEDLADASPPFGHAPRDDLGLDEPACVMFTSGTSGRPKGALSTQRSELWSAAASYATHLAMTEADELLWPLPVHHAFGDALGVMGVIAVGAGEHIIDEPQRAQAALRLLGQQRFTMFAGVPTTFSQVLEALRSSGAQVPRTLRLCLTSGAPAPSDLRDAVSAAFGAPLLDSYGSTEHFAIASQELGGSGTEQDDCVSPLPGVEIRIIDPQSGHDLADDAEGEIWLRGPGLLLEYCGQPEATAEAFADGGWLRTRDLGRFLAPGRLKVSGRVDDLIIRGGENIHPAEVEAVLLRHPDVLDAAVVAAPDAVFGQVPVAFVVSAGARDVDWSAALREVCAAALPPPQMPDEFHEVDRIPRTGIGKVLRRELQERLPAVRQQAVDSWRAGLADLAAPARRAALLDFVLEETLSISGEASPDAVFTDVGLTSLGTLQLVHRLAVRTGLNLSRSLLFDQPTPADVARHLDTELHGLSTSTPAAASAASAVTSEPSSDPVAIIAMSCRFPGGVQSPEDLWRLVCSDSDAITPFPTDRGWDVEGVYDPDPDAIGRTYTRSGGFLDNVAEFDGTPFGISPREAIAMDPQQRLLLELSWEALERAGIAAQTLRESSRTAVYIGQMHGDYHDLVGPGPHELEAQLAVGTSSSVTSGRIAYTFGFQGPVATVDTACSSSLVALHLASGSLRSGECSLALVGGVTVLSTPGAFVAFSRQRLLSRDGHCRSFADDADGAVWSEGAGILVLERLSDARRNGHPVLAVLRGSAVNADGASNGLTAPNGTAQRALIRTALADARLDPDDIDLVDGHGTGTVLGDPIEAQALLAEYGAHRDPARPLWLGSVKSHLGHPQAAAGIAGVIKMVEAMRHKEMPRSLHAHTPTRHVDWSTGDVALLAQNRPWPSEGRPRRAAVSGFGIGGTNAHVILEEPPTETTLAPATDLNHPPIEPTHTPPLLLNAADSAALRAQAAQIAEFWQSRPALSATDLAFSLATTRSALHVRAAAYADTRDAQIAALRSIGRGAASSDAVVATAAGSAASGGQLALLFSGQGSQRLGMGRDLAQQRFPAFRRALDAVCDAFRAHLDEPLQDVMFDNALLLGRTDYTQAAIFAFEVAMFRQFEAWGVTPHRLVGHSVGEIAAAHVADVLSLEDACTLVAARGRLMAALPAGGAMVAIEATEDEAVEAIAAYANADQVSIAAVNGPRAVVLSGAADRVDELAAYFTRHDRRTVRLDVSHAFHSPLIEPILEDLREVAAKLTFRPARHLLISTVTGEPITAQQLAEPDYWVRQARSPVRFADAMTRLRDLGTRAFLEIGPSPTLIGHAKQCLGAAPTDPAFVAVASTDAAGDSLLAALAKLHVVGVGIDWHAVYADTEARLVDLPTYPFQRKRYWLDAPSRPTLAAATHDAHDHPLLGAALPDPDSGRTVYAGSIATQNLPWLLDHVIDGKVLLPGSAFIEMAARVAADCQTNRVDELIITTPLELSPDASVRIQTIVTEPDPSGRHTFKIYSRPIIDTPTQSAPPPWTLHVTGLFGSPPPTPDSPGPPALPSPWPPTDSVPVLVDAAYQSAADYGITYGPAFRRVTTLWTHGPDSFADVALPATEHETRDAAEYLVHPALLDAALHVGALVDPEALRLPYAFHGIELGLGDGAAAPSRLRVQLTQTAAATAEVSAVDEAGHPLFRISSVLTRELKRADPVLTDVVRRGLFRVTWEPADVAPPAVSQLITVPYAPPDTDVIETTRTLIRDTLASLQHHLTDPSQAGTHLTIALPDAPSPASLPSLSYGAIAGLVRSVQGEYPGHITLSTAGTSNPSPTLVPATLDTSQPRTWTIDPDRTVLITGGTGALGAVLSRHLVVAHSARHLVLTSRRGLEAPGAPELLSELTVLGASAHIVPYDVTDPAAVHRLIESCDPPLGAVVHTAGVLDDGVLIGQTGPRFERVLATKGYAAWTLHEATRDLDLSAFVLYSSASGLLSRPGQANYAAANAFLDALARHRRVLGLPAISLAWGPWEQEGGMANQSADGVPEHLRGNGVRALTSAEAMALFDASQYSPEPVLAPILLEPNRQPHAPTPSPAPTAGAWRNLLADQTTPAARRRVLEALIGTELAALVGYQEDDELLTTRHFTELGFDSLTSLQARSLLVDRTGVQLPVTIMFENPTLPELAAAIEAQLDCSGA